MIMKGTSSIVTNILTTIIFIIIVTIIIMMMNKIIKAGQSARFFVMQAQGVHVHRNVNAREHF